VEIFLQKF